jgi:hypothetical protein
MPDHVLKSVFQILSAFAVQEGSSPDRCVGRNGAAYCAGGRRFRHAKFGKKPNKNITRQAPKKGAHRLNPR